jgi:hypothetical protein
VCTLCDPPRPGRREDTFSGDVAGAAAYNRGRFEMPDDRPTLAEAEADEWGAP